MARRSISVWALVALVGLLAVYSGLTDHGGRRRGTEVLGVKITPPPAVGAMAVKLPEQAARGVKYTGLELATSGKCVGAYVGKKSNRCSHGPDAAPPGVDLLRDPPRPPLVPRLNAAGGSGPQQGTQSEVTSSIVCDGDGVTGKRVQAIYARASDAPDRYATFLSSIRGWAAIVDDTFNTSAAATGGLRHVRYVTDPACNLVVDNVVLSSVAAGDFDATIAELETKGYNRTDRIYLVWFDANVYCGIGTLWVDDRPPGSSPENANNSGPSYARVDNRCWGFDASVEAHEILHTLGGVQLTAPHATTGHCFDENDRMCYDDGSGIPMQNLCPDSGLDRLLDCNHDDYFHTKPVSPNYLATHWNAAMNGFLIQSDLIEGGFTPLVPARILDTRDGTGGISTRIQGGQPVDVQVTGRGGIPSPGVSAAVLNVTVTNATTSGGFLSVYPAGQPPPNASNLNFIAGDTVPNLVLVKAGQGGKVSVFLNDGLADVLFDVAGYISDSPPSGVEGRFRALPPSRILDTREGIGGFSTKLAPGQSIDVQVGDRGGVPSSGAAAVVLNATVTNPTTPAGFLTLYPTGQSLPLASNLNFRSGQTVANRVVVKLGDSGKISVYNPSGTTDVILDVGGWFADGSAPVGAPGTTIPVVPNRILDTRNGNGGFSSPIQGGQPIDVQVTGRGGVPTTGVSAVVMNVTVTAPTTLGGFLTVYPSGESLPLASDLNFVSPRTVPNLVVVKVGSGGRVSVFLNDGTAHVLFDVVGYLK